MHALYLFSVWLHILAAATWIGGMFFLVLVVVPWLRRGDRARAAELLRETGTRFRTVGWTCFALLAVTGIFNASVRGVGLADLTSADWHASAFGQALTLKLVLFLLVVGLSVIHDFRIGPRATDAIRRDPASPEAARLRRLASAMGRVNVLLALALVALGVTLVRGFPW